DTTEEMPSWLNDKASSVKVIKALAYKDPDFFAIGLAIDGDIPALTGSVNFNDVMSSIKVAPGYSVRLYSNTGYQGKYIDVRGGESIANLSSVNMNNNVSSISVSKTN